MVKKFNTAVWLLVVLALAACGRAGFGGPTPSLPPFPLLSPTASRTPLVFTTPTPLPSETPAPDRPLPTATPRSGGVAFSTPANFTWPTPRPRPTQAAAASTLTPLAFSARLEKISELARLGQGTLLYFAFSPDGRWLGLSVRRGIALYDAQTYRPLRFISTPTEMVRLAFSPDGDLLAAADRNSRVTLFNPTSGGTLRVLDNGALNTPLALSFFAGGSLLTVDTSSEISVVWETASGKMVHRWITTGNAAMAASADGVVVATSNWNGSIYFWTLQDGRSTGRVWADSEVLSMQFTPDGLSLLAGYGDGTTIAWGLDGGKALHTFKSQTDRVVSLAVSPDSRLAATGSWDNSICLWNMTSGELLYRIEGHTGRIVQVGFNADGSVLASYGEDGRLRLWSVSTGAPLQVLNDFAPPGNATFTPDGKMVVTGAQDGWLSWWDLSGTLLREELADPAGISALQISPGGEWIATGGTDGPVRLWDTASGQLIAEFDGSEAWVNCLAFSPDGRWLAASGEGGILRTWDLTSGQPSVEIDTGETAVLRVAYSPDGRWLAAGSLSGAIGLWPTGTSGPGHVLRSEGTFVSALAFSPDGYTLATGGDDKIISLWRLAGASATFTPAGKTADGLAALAFSPDGQVLVASFWDRSLRFYSATTGSLIQSVELPFSARQIQVAPDGRQIALSLDDGTVRLWGIQ